MCEFSRSSALMQSCTRWWQYGGRWRVTMRYRSLEMMRRILRPTVRTLRITAPVDVGEAVYSAMVVLFYEWIKAGLPKLYELHLIGFGRIGSSTEVGALVSALGGLQSQLRILTFDTTENYAEEILYADFCAALLRCVHLHTLTLNFTDCLLSDEHAAHLATLKGMPSLRRLSLLLDSNQLYGAGVAALGALGESSSLEYLKLSLNDNHLRDPAVMDVLRALQANNNNKLRTVLLNVRQNLLSKPVVKMLRKANKAAKFEIHCGQQCGGVLFFSVVFSVVVAVVV